MELQGTRAATDCKADLTVVSLVCATTMTCRCVCNNYDISGFWKNWHASFNRWLIRYMYIPMGGAKSRLLNVWPIFTFVALWHDLEWHLLKWAWLMALFIAPEVICKSIIRQPKWRSRWQQPAFHHLCAAAAAAYITVGFLLLYVPYCH
jgi:protein-cysteine N-palmitoyltransferase HHAT